MGQVVKLLSIHLQDKNPFCTNWRAVFRNQITDFKQVGFDGESKDQPRGHEVGSMTMELKGGRGPLDCGSI
jgi:hypothetical protein